jgi:alpha-amylase
VIEGYACTQSHTCISAVFYPHIYNWNLKTQIAALIKARKNAGVTSTSAVVIQRATRGLYAAIITGTTHQLAMKIGPNSWRPGAGWTLQTSGNNYAIWMR